MSSWLSSPARVAVAVSPSDSTILTNVRGLYIGGSGDLVVTMDGGDVTFSSVPIGVLPICPTKVKAATTATSILALK